MGTAQTNHRQNRLYRQNRDESMFDVFARPTLKGRPVSPAAVGTDAEAGCRGLPSPQPSPAGSGRIAGRGVMPARIPI
jgi:hypothetical protein